MREIKFKAWDDDRMISMVMDREMTLQNIIRFGNHLYSKRDTLVFMQYTGLHDKNGVEICEGDIVRRELGGAKAVVQYAGGAFIARWDETIFNKVMYFWDVDGFKIEVIGNIYENPDLLSKETAV